jgi:RNase P subunit RPR2
VTTPPARPAAPPTRPATLEELCRGCDEPLPDDDPGVEAYVTHEDGGEQLFLYCAECARERGL